MLPPSPPPTMCPSEPDDRPEPVDRAGWSELDWIAFSDERYGSDFNDVEESEVDG